MPKQLINQSFNAYNHPRPSLRLENSLLTKEGSLYFEPTQIQPISFQQLAGAPQATK
jgi:hypothetical protein